MPNEVKYKNQVWGEPISGERLSTNGHYTGEHKGTVMQDASVDGTEQPHSVEEGIIRYGTMMQDAVSGSTPDEGFGVKYVLTGCTTNGDKVAVKNSDYEATITAEGGYTLPSTITVKVDGTTLTAGPTVYTYSSSTGAVKILAASVTGEIEITVTATA